MIKHMLRQAIIENHHFIPASVDLFLRGESGDVDFSGNALMTKAIGLAAKAEVFGVEHVRPFAQSSKGSTVSSPSHGLHQFHQANNGRRGLVFPRVGRAETLATSQRHRNRRSQ